MLLLKLFSITTGRDDPAAAGCAAPAAG